MIHLSLAGHQEHVYPDASFFPKEFHEQGRDPLYAQWRTYDALVHEDASIVLNTYATGSGKTKAALLYLHELRRRPLSQANCLFIAPTNELLRQHARDIQTFCRDNDLDYQVLPLTSKDMDDYARQIAEIAPGMTRRAAKLVEVLKNPRVLRDVNEQEAIQQRPYVLVTNPDIFYYAVYNGYGRHEERPLITQFLGGFDYLVIDELHYYNPKQLANFLFFLTAWKHFGIFQSNAKVCLLSATPNSHVWQYLRNLNIPLTEISPDNEPKDASLPSVASLAPVELDLYTQEEAGSRGLVDLVSGRYAGDVRVWLAGGQHGAIISGALWRINLMHDELLRAGISTSQMARLTGVQRREAREQATRRDLILATPTVDLGYNFERKGKPRQSIDFLFFDAAFSDEFVQRLGRAGRVLGKAETTIPSRAFAVLPKELIESLRPLAGRSITRTELRLALRDALAEKRIPERNIIFDYIASGSIQEAFLPILRLRDMAGETKEEDIEDLYEKVRSLFGAPEKATFKRLKAITRRFKDEREVFRGAPTDPNQLVPYLLKLPNHQALKLWVGNRTENRGGYPRVTPEQLAQLHEKVNKPESPMHAPFVEWAVKTQQEYAVREASFSFRESFEEPLARIYDPNHLISDDTINDYGLFHLVQNCEMEVLPQGEWLKQSGASAVAHDAEQIVVYSVVRRLRAYEDRLRLRFRLAVNAERRAWENDHIGKMTALLNLELFAETGQVPEAVMDAVKHRFIPAFLAPRDSMIGGKLIGLARSQGMRTYDSEITFADGSKGEYCMLLGTSALLIAARLRWASTYHQKEHNQGFSDPIWC